MKAEQRASSSYWVDGSAPPYHIDTTIELEVPGEGDSDVTTYLAYQTKFPSRLQEQLREGIYDGVHEGIAMAGMSLEPSGITVRIARLKVSPMPDNGSPAQINNGLVNLVKTLTADTVRGLWTGLAALAEPRSA